MELCQAVTNRPYFQNDKYIFRSLSACRIPLQYQLRAMHSVSQSYWKSWVFHYIFPFYSQTAVTYMIYCRTRICRSNKCALFLFYPCNSICFCFWSEISYELSSQASCTVFHRYKSASIVHLVTQQSFTNRARAKNLFKVLIWHNFKIEILGRTNH